MFNVSFPETKDVIPADAPQLGKSSADAATLLAISGTNAGLLEGQQKRRKLREKKTPAFAVSVLVQLPSRHTSRPSSRDGAQTPKSIRPSQSLSSSFGSDLQSSSWSFLESMPRSLSSSRTLADNIDNRINNLVDHWDVITRALSSLERRASKSILDLLKQADTASPVPLPKPPKESSMQRTNQLNVTLPQWALATDQGLREAATHVIHRINYALQIPRAIVGLGLSRGGPWVEEARCVARLCGGRDQNFFLFNLLTAFLGSHTEWLSLLGPEWYRRRHRMQRRARQDVEPLLSRTVIVCDERSAGRRLVFLLASFLPGTSRAETLGSPFRPGTSRSLKHSSSQSPPLGQVSRQESLRRTINRRARDNRMAAGSFSRQEHSTSASSIDGDGFPKTGAMDIMSRRLQRHNSGSGSVRLHATLSIPTNESSARKSSAGTTSTVTPDATTPVAHFSSGSIKGDSYFPGGVGIISPDTSASADLSRHLRRDTGSNADGSSGQSATSTKCGSLLSGVSGFWSTRQDSSTGISGPTILSTSPNVQAGLGSGGEPPSIPKSRSKLESMADEVSQSRESSDTTPQGFARENSQVEQHTRDAPRPKALPLRLKVDENEGVVDVDINLPGFLSSSPDSGLGSPPPRIARHTPSLTSLDGYASMHSSISKANASPQQDFNIQSSVAGFLRRYHEDFVLQSVRPYAKLEDDIRASMFSEPTPTHAIVCSTLPSRERSEGHWVNVCTTLVADVRTFSIKRLSLRRKILAPSSDSAVVEAVPRSPTLSPNPSTSTNPTKTKVPPPLELPLEEEITSETVMDLDATLTDAIERILGRSSGQSSRAPSPTRLSHSRNISTSTASTANTNVAAASFPISSKDTLSPALDFPRHESQKMVVTALEDVVRSVSADLNHNPNGRNIGVDEGLDQASQTPLKPEDSALREGVKKWLLCVENTEVW